MSWILTIALFVGIFITFSLFSAFIGGMFELDEPRECWTWKGYLALIFLTIMMLVAIHLLHLAAVDIMRVMQWG